MTLNKSLYEKLVETIHFVSAKGWTPATSSNFSVRLNDDPNKFAISKSGVDKNRFSLSDLMIIDNFGNKVDPKDPSPSAETLLHTMLYNIPYVSCVLHTHSLNTTLISRKFAKDFKICFEGLEILKAFPDITSHNSKVELPIFANSQDIEELSQEINSALDLRKFWGFLLAGHGIYVWGKSIDEARRHLEAFEYLSEMELNYGDR